MKLLLGIRCDGMPDPPGGPGRPKMVCGRCGAKCWEPDDPDALGDSFRLICEECTFEEVRLERVIRDQQENPLDHWKGF